MSVMREGRLRKLHEKLMHLPRTKLKDIEPYGRCSEEDNRNNVTGAKGVPNFGGESGAQLLAITVADGEIINIRWTGKKYTVLDYELMTVRERNALDSKDLDEIEKDREQMRENADGAENDTDSTESDVDAVN